MSLCMYMIHFFAWRPWNLQEVLDQLEELEIQGVVSHDYSAGN